MFVRIEGLQLQQQAFAQIAGADADRIEFLHDGQRFVEIVLGSICPSCDDFFDGSGQVAVFVEVADDAFGEFLARCRSRW